MSEEKLRILKLLESKKISAAEAMDLLDALGRTSSTQREGHGRLLRIRIHESGSAEPKVNINVPLGWAKFMAPFIEGQIKAKLGDNGYNVDLGKIQEAIESQEP